MSMTERPTSMPSAGVSEAEIRGRATDTFRDPPDTFRESRPVRSLRETKLSFLTTEFWAMVAGIAALVVLYNVTDNPDMTLWRTALLSTVIASAYIVSRGWAKSGSQRDRVEHDRTYR